MQFFVCEVANCACCDIQMVWVMSGSSQLETTKQHSATYLLVAQCLLFQCLKGGDTL